MKNCKTVSSKGRERKAWNKGARKHFPNERRKHLSDKGSYITRVVNGWKNMKIPRIFDETYVNDFTPENISDTSDEEEQSSDEVKKITKEVRHSER